MLLCSDQRRCAAAPSVATSTAPSRVAVTTRLPSRSASPVGLVARRDGAVGDAVEFLRQASAGIPDDALTDPSRLEGVRAISRTSCPQFEDTAKSMRQADEELGAGMILHAGAAARRPPRRHQPRER
jgi:hypothetical protein